MSAPHKTYRVSSFDAVLKTVTQDLIDAANDHEVIASVEREAFGSKCEIWDGERLVAQLPQQPLQQQA